jgi:PleD family two-component response regulator
MDTILVVSDEASNLGVISRLLRLQGHKVLEASNGSEAIEISHCHHGPIRLLITDLQLRSAWGTDVAVSYWQFVKTWESCLFRVRLSLRGVLGSVLFLIPSNRTLSIFSKSHLSDVRWNRRFAVFCKEGLKCMLERQTVLILCTGNSARSQMAEGLLRPRRR